ncbi:YajG family lipoprotein [Vibrio tubiashii]|uniref:Lipoprotein n=2 Tax=Vibrio tubiashii TaxID=29498 RepID=F9T5X5_9VIBR|nr:YajG family lipoprotein [Vibrio tubiashii]AIW14921.1 lipoprotein [Vibrio tubiashii ATCC 19109]EGU54814.1 putative lipoprotein [Vibrio tubiashii ATCC 19109]EIF05548.1 putative lipoprotein [Vibrio tubiashii NCIMB 1337 = ATCC 19106]MCG9578328.1 YajG family lipoprotein [Vibrio tubiashii]MCG9581646.1 YajG family lipoprotein [Vibrio tubiashii]
MRKLVLAASMALLTACSAPQQEQINFMPKAVLSNSDIVQDASFTLTSKDMRSAQYVALVDSGRSNIEPIHSKQNVRISIENALLDQFKSQGFRSTVNSENSVEVEVQEALVSVKHTVMENQMDGKVVLEITAETPQGKLVKTYTGTAKRTGALSASNEEIEEVLNDVINLVLQEVSNDRELQNYMQERF